VRVLLDTNVWIAAFVSRGGVCSALLEHCSEAHDLVSSEGLLEEYREKLIGKFRLSPEAAEARVALVRPILQLVDPEPLPIPVCRDPDDDLVLATAIAGSCHCIITGDKDLLVLGQYGGVAVISPSEFSAFEGRAADTA
jgi:putative PIN family toxin of toxin-antitoxin system